MGEALSRVSQVKRVPGRARAQATASTTTTDPVALLERDGEGAVDIPCWRHAIINFPHPLLQQGLVILDTPGLNAIGTEPELTLNLLPNAHAVLFILAADAGVTKTDLEVWNRHLAGDDPAHEGRPHRHPEQDRRPVGRARSPKPTIDAEIERQVRDDRAAARRSGRAGVRGVGAEGAARQGQRRRRAAREKPAARARGRAVAQAHPRQARHRRRGDAGRGARARRGRARDARRAADEHRRAARRAARAARQEPGRRRAHDGARARGEGALRARPAALHRAAHRVHAADERALRRHRPRGAARERRAHAPPASRAARSPRACAAR